ncbi:hypothetical protein J5N97_014357 [Dioscorea zingiberensis]|uniref:Uncharacterized protein n=1 Tax=Dioscorea zingiberensis TaxID=325984 RepID=A0A9D5CTB1_9LILI|nr:hypothetical protein J5N97_014357 [Dioscorea zingiberensis]
MHTDPSFWKQVSRIRLIYCESDEYHGSGQRRRTEHQDEETFGVDDEDDIANLLPDSFDLNITDEMSILEAELEETIQEMEAAEESTLASLTKEKSGLDLDAAALIKSLSLKSPKNGVAKPVLEVAKYREKPVQCMSPKCSPRRIIQQPR